MKYLEGILIWDDPRYGATIGQDIELSQAVLAEAGDGSGSQQRPFCLFESGAIIEAETTDKTGAEIGVEIAALDCRCCLASIDVASCH